MTQLAINTETFEKLLDVLDHRILQIKEALREVGLTEEAKEVLERDLETCENLYEQARDETGHVWSGQGNT